MARGRSSTRSTYSRRKTWKKGKVFTKGRKKVRYIYPNGKKKGRKLVSASGRRRR